MIKAIFISFILSYFKIPVEFGYKITKYGKNICSIQKNHA